MKIEISDELVQMVETFIDYYNRPTGDQGDDLTETDKLDYGSHVITLLNEAIKKPQQKTMRIVVLDFSNSDVDIIDEIPYMEDSDAIENYLVERLQYNTDEINWMVATDSRINYLTPDDFC